MTIADRRTSSDAFYSVAHPLIYHIVFHFCLCVSSTCVGSRKLQNWPTCRANFPKNMQQNIAKEWMRTAVYMFSKI